METQEPVMCIGKNNDQSDFVWDEGKISCFGLYCSVIAKRNTWCDCLECFKKRYVASEKLLAPISEYKNISQYNSAILSGMRY